MTTIVLGLLFAILLVIVCGKICDSYSESVGDIKPPTLYPREYEKYGSIFRKINERRVRKYLHKVEEYQKKQKQLERMISRQKRMEK